MADVPMTTAGQPTPAAPSPVAPGPGTSVQPGGPAAGGASAGAGAAPSPGPGVARPAPGGGSTVPPAPAGGTGESVESLRKALVDTKRALTDGTTRSAQEARELRVQVQDLQRQLAQRPAAPPAPPAHDPFAGAVPFATPQQKADAYQAGYEEVLATYGKEGALAYAQDAWNVVQHFAQKPLWAYQLGLVRGEAPAAPAGVPSEVAQRLAALEERVGNEPSARDVILRGTVLNRAISQAAKGLDLDQAWLEAEATIGEENGQSITGTRRDAIEIFIEERPGATPDQAILALFPGHVREAWRAIERTAAQQEAQRAAFAGGSLPPGSRTTPFPEPTPNAQVVEALQPGATPRLQYVRPEKFARRVWNPGAGKM